MEKDLLNGLTEEQIAKVKACKDQEEILNFAKAEGIEFSDEQLDSITGAGMCSDAAFRYPNCGSSNVKSESYKKGDVFSWGYICTCKDCGHEWKK